MQFIVTEISRMIPGYKYMCLCVMYSLFLARYQFNHVQPKGGSGYWMLRRRHWVLFVSEVSLTYVLCMLQVLYRC